MEKGIFAKKVTQDFSQRVNSKYALRFAASNAPIFLQAVKQGRVLSLPLSNGFTAKETIALK